MNKWLLAVPCWGDHYISRFLDATLPGIKASLAFAGNPTAAFIIQTDEPARFATALEGFAVTYRPAPTEGDKYKRFGDAHREAADFAALGQWVMFLTADVMLSRETFLACAQRFADGKRAIACCSTRTYSEVLPSPGMTAPELLDWTMAHKHETIEGAFWGGKSRPPSTKYFQSADGEHITLRCFHMHPLAVVKDRELTFAGTLDMDLLDRFSTDEIHVVQACDELALAEMSPEHIPWHPATEALGVAEVAAWARRANLTPMNLWLSKHRIIITGTGETNDEEIWCEVLHAIDNPPPTLARPAARRHAHARAR